LLCGGTGKVSRWFCDFAYWNVEYTLPFFCNFMSSVHLDAHGVVFQDKQPLNLPPPVPPVLESRGDPVHGAH